MTFGPLQTPKPAGVGLRKGQDGGQGWGWDVVAGYGCMKNANSADILHALHILWSFNTRPCVTWQRIEHSQTRAAGGRAIWQHIQNGRLSDGILKNRTLSERWTWPKKNNEMLTEASQGSDRPNGNTLDECAARHKPFIVI